MLFMEVEDIAPQDKLVRQKIKEYTLQLAEVNNLCSYTVCYYLYVYYY